MHVCVYVHEYVCIDVMYLHRCYVSMYAENVCMSVCMYMNIDAEMYVSMYAFMSVCIYMNMDTDKVCMQRCMYVCMYVCKYMNMEHIYVCRDVYT